ncbi:MAG: hypothetical protein WBF83_05135 [Moheibacter sp.]|jgi:hypothetical protein
MKAKFIFSLLFCTTFFWGFAQERMMIFDGKSKEHMYYVAESDELVSINKVEGQYTFAVLDDMSLFMTMDNEENIIAFDVSEHKFEKDPDILTMFVADDNNEELAVVINEETMMLVISYEVNGRIELDRYELTWMGFDDELDEEDEQ